MLTKMAYAIVRRRNAYQLATRLAPVLASHPYARAAATGIRMYNTGRAAAPYARAAISLFKKRQYMRWSPKKAAAKNKKKKRANMRKVGERVGTSNAKHATDYYNDQNWSSQTLYQFPLLNLTKASTDAYDRRVVDIVNMRGIKFCINIRRNPDTVGSNALNDAKIYCNLAIISPKANLESSEVVPTTDFFRSTGGTRSVNFDNVTLRPLDYRCNPINTDLYNVHKHMRFMLGIKESFIETDQVTKEWYWPIKRQIRYENATANPVGKQVYLLFWCANSAEGTANTANVCKGEIKMIKYYRESLGRV